MPDFKLWCAHLQLAKYPPIGREKSLSLHPSITPIIAVFLSWSSPMHCMLNVSGKNQQKETYLDRRVWVILLHFAGLILKMKKCHILIGPMFFFRFCVSQL
jgi:hypothetical protein